MAETDDDHEWIPNPRQTGVIPNVHVTQEMVNAWTDFLDQSQKILAGEVLIPFWQRADDGIAASIFAKYFCNQLHWTWCYGCRDLQRLPIWKGVR